MTTLADLEALMAALIRRRQSALDTAEQIVKQANREFDREAKPLGLQINQLREQEEKSKPVTTTSKQQSKRQSVSYAGLTDEEAEHMRELLERTD